MKNIKKKFKEFLDNFIKVISRPEMAILPGQLAFFFVLALVPTITLISYGATFLNLSTDVIFTFISNAFSSDIANLLLNSNSTIIYGGFQFFMAIVVGYYIASNGAASIIVTSNTIYGEKDSGFFYRRFKALIMTFFLVLLFIFMLIVPVFGDKIIELINFVDLNPTITNRITVIMTFLRGPVTWFIMFIFIKIIYTLAPNRKMKSKSVGYGALFTSFGWILATYGYSYYISHYANYTAFYGGLANLVILMLWFYVLAFIFTIGMALNYRKEEVELEKTGTLNLKN
ncbi:MAG: YihY/virulence factor BrkB family protein [Bacilli bacterium]